MTKCLKTSVEDLQSRGTLNDRNDTQTAVGDRCLLQSSSRENIFVKQHNKKTLIISES